MISNARIEDTMRVLAKKRIFTTLWLLWTIPVLLPPAAPAKEPSPADANAKLPQAKRAAASKPHPAVVRVAAPEGNATSYGSGTLVGASGKHGLVLTNWHVVRDATGEVSVRFPDGSRSPATVLTTDRTWDLAALLIQPPTVRPVNIATTTPQRGDRMTIVGFGSGQYREASGKVVQFVSPGKGEPFEMLEVDVGARQGDSGGPILDRRGQMAGVLFGSANGCTNGSHCGRVRRFLRRALKNLPSLNRSIAPGR